MYHTQFSLVHFCLKFLVTQLWAFHKIEVETLSSRIATIQMLLLASGSNFSHYFFQYHCLRYENKDMPCISIWNLVIAQIRLSALKTEKLRFLPVCIWIQISQTLDPINLYFHSLSNIRHQMIPTKSGARHGSWTLDFSIGLTRPCLHLHRRNCNVAH